MMGDPSPRPYCVSVCGAETHAHGSKSSKEPYRGIRQVMFESELCTPPSAKVGVNGARRYGAKLIETKRDRDLNLTPMSYKKLSKYGEYSRH